MWKAIGRDKVCLVRLHKVHYLILFIDLIKPTIITNNQHINLANSLLVNPK